MRFTTTRLYLILLLLSIGWLNTPSFAKTGRHHCLAKTGRHQFQSLDFRQLTAELDHLLANKRSRVTIGVVVKSMKSGETIYTHNDQHFFMPASTLKVLTAEAALLYLGPNFTFDTQFKTDALSSHQGLLAGNLYLVHNGDPSLTYDDIADLIAALKARSIQKISGNVYIDTSAYDDIDTGPGWLWTDKKYCYGSPINASIINHNCLSFTLFPSKITGQKAKLAINPHYYFPAINNSVITTVPHRHACSFLMKMNGPTGVNLSGCIPRNSAPRGITTVITNTMLYNKQLLQALFKEYGIQFQGKILPGTAPSNTAVLASHSSQPLQHLINEMLKKSDNIIAGSLLKKIGQQYSHRPGSWENGGNAVLQILAQKAAVNIWHMVIIDGSGLSRYNKVNPAQLMQVLDFAYHHVDTNYAFVSALPIAGIDGTLKHRLNNVSWKVRAKTGTMTGILSLAGYAMSADKEPLAFVIMVNGSAGSNWQYKKIEDTIVTYLTHSKR